MNLDRKFLEGFSEVSAANGLTPSQAHQLLTKEARFGTVLKLLGAAGAGAAGGTYLLNKGNQYLINRSNRISDYYNPEVYGYGVPTPAPATQSTPAPHYTSWGEDNSIANKQWGSSLPANTPAAPATPAETSGKPTLSKSVMPITESALNAKEIAEAQGAYDKAKQQFSHANRQVEDTNKQYQIYKDRLTQPNIIRENFALGPVYNWWNSRGLQKQMDALETLTELQRDRQEQFTAADRARANAMK